MSSNSEETSDYCILYELLEYSKWEQDPELLVADFTARVTLQLRLGLFKRLICLKEKGRDRTACRVDEDVCEEIFCF